MSGPRVFADLIEHLSELLVLAEPDDGPIMAAIGQRCQELRAAAVEAGRDDVADRAESAGALAERIGAGQLPDPAGALRLLGMTCDELRRMVDAEAPGEMVPADDLDLVTEFVVKATEFLDQADTLLLAIERGEGVADSIDAVFRAFHTIKGMTGFLGLSAIQALAHEGESLMEPARKDANRMDGDLVQRLFEMVDRIRGQVSLLAEGTTEADPQMLLVGTVTGPTPESSADPAVASATGSAATARGGSASGSAVLAAARRETVHVDAQRLEQLLDAVGEIVIAGSMLESTAKDELGVTSALAQQLRQLEKLTRQLHGMAGALRMVPLAATFQRMARTVRDVARKADKQVDFVVSGAETEIDRVVVDRIGDSLVHLLRNAVDHGIEDDVAARVAAGKSEVGRIELRAYHRGGSIHVEVADDGAGLDAESILDAAVRAGLIAEDAAVSEREIRDLIFRPGLSTNAEITDVSGRGVGMDVVRSTVEALGGQVGVRSEAGVGTTFSMRLPMTLAVIDGMVVRADSQRYIVPTLSVLRSVRPEPTQISRVLGVGELMEVDGELIRLIRLDALFGSSGRGHELTESIVMVVEDDGRHAGLVIDEIVGQQQIVIKPIGEALGDVPGVSGGAVMPDARVGLILDVGGLVALANESVN